MTKENAPVKHAQDAVQRETAPQSERKLRTVFFELALISLLALFGFLAVLANTTQYFNFDLIVTRNLQTISFPWFVNLMRLISWPGFPPQTVIIPVLLTVLMFFLGLRWEAIVAMFAALLAMVLNLVVKTAVGRPRPPANLVDVFETLNSYSFPSGHVMYYTAFFGFLWFLAFTLLKHSWKRTAILVFFGLLILTVGVSRIYLGEHWASDVMGAYILGGLSLYAALVVYRWGKSRFFFKQPVK